MKSLRRYFQPGQTVFVTCVTHYRRHLLIDHNDLLESAARRAARKHRFRIIAWVVLPDHLHLLFWSKSHAASAFMKSFKETFARGYRSRHKLRSGRLWHHRYWDHVIRDEADWRRHIDYIHYNPVKHGFLDDPFRWRFSSLRRFHSKEMYEDNWGRREPDFGEVQFGE